VFGPDAAAARIEGSKAYAKSLMAAAGIPTGRSAVVRSLDEGAAALDLLGPPYVVKADGLAAGKGVVVTEERAEAQAALGERLSGAFGDAGRTVVIEEFLEGPELSLIAFADGQTAVACAPARDYKRLRDGDEGPNTGGMGSYSPVPGCDDDLVERILGEIMEPLLKETAARGAPFVGALYAGLALTPAGPRVIEFNARFGDPETQALIPRLESDLGAVCLACARGELSGVRLRWSPQACVSVVLAAPGYPASPGTGAVISGVEQACCLRDVQVFQAGTAERDGALVTAGGRVLVVSARGHGLEAARARAYEAAGLISFEGVQRRNDIAVAGGTGLL
jgi:phosphoribosylamine--glycine ligase